MQIDIPQNLLPSDGRFGSGPAKVRRGTLENLLARSDVMGTSHRQAPVRGVVRDVQAGLADLYRLPEGYEVVLGNGGSTAFWDVAVFSLIEERSAHGVFGEFTRKFARASAAAPSWPNRPCTRHSPAVSPCRRPATPTPTAGRRTRPPPVPQLLLSASVTDWYWWMRRQQPVASTPTSPTLTSTTSHRRRTSPLMVVCGSPSRPRQLWSAPNPSGQAAAGFPTSSIS